MRIIKLKFWFLIRFLCNFVAARQSHQSHVKKKEKKSNTYKTKNDNKKQLLLVQHNDLYEKRRKLFKKNTQIQSTNLLIYLVLIPWNKNYSFICFYYLLNEEHEMW